MINDLNALGKKREPFFFCVSYDKKEFIVHPLSKLPSTISFTLEGVTSSCTPYNNLSIPSPSLVASPCSFERYHQGFKTITDNIQAGNSYILNYTCATPITTPLSLNEIYHASCAPFKLLVEEKFVIFSPERFIKISDSLIETFPMKGTIDATKENAQSTLLADEKEQSEHLMIVDLLRNDLSMVASDVCVQRYRYPHTIHAGAKRLIQTSSHITGKLDPSWHDSIGTLLDKLLPAGSITGAPKRSTCQIIDQVESTPRGFYTGIFGIYDGTSLDSAVAIRFIHQTPEGLSYHSGGGITALSNPYDEYNEMIEKIYVPIH